MLKVTFFAHEFLLEKKKEAAALTLCADVKSRALIFFFPLLFSAPTLSSEVLYLLKYTKEDHGFPVSP